MGKLGNQRQKTETKKVAKLDLKAKRKLKEEKRAEKNR